MHAMCDKRSACRQTPMPASAIDATCIVRYRYVSTAVAKNKEQQKNGDVPARVKLAYLFMFGRCSSEREHRSTQAMIPICRRCMTCFFVLHVCKFFSSGGCGSFLALPAAGHAWAPAELLCVCSGNPMSRWLGILLVMVSHLAEQRRAMETHDCSFLFVSLVLCIVCDTCPP